MSLHLDLTRLAARAERLRLAVSHLRRLERAVEAALIAHPEIRNAMADALNAEGYDTAHIRTDGIAPINTLEASA